MNATRRQGRPKLPAESDVSTIMACSVPGWQRPCGSGLARQRRDGWGLPMHRRLLRIPKAPDPYHGRTKYLRDLSCFCVSRIDRAPKPLENFAGHWRVGRRPDCIGLPPCGRNKHISKGASMSGRLGRVVGGRLKMPPSGPGGGGPQPQPNPRTSSPGGGGGEPQGGTGGGTPNGGGGGSNRSIYDPRGPDFRQGGNQPNIPTGGQFPCPNITVPCMREILKAYVNEHAQARAAWVINLESSTPPKPKLPGEKDYHPCANFGITLAACDLQLGNEPARDKDELMNRIGYYKAYGWLPAVPVSDNGEFASWAVSI